MAFEVDDIGFDKLLAEKRHKELVSAISKVSSLISDMEMPETDISPLGEAMDNNRKLLEQLISKIESIGNSKIEVKTDTKELAKIVGELKNGMELIRKELGKEVAPIEWEFKIKRNPTSNLIDLVTAKQK
jgi:chromosome segregation ATPase